MRCVCFNCSKILALDSDPQYKAAQKQKRPHERFKMMLNACKGKRLCQGGDALGEDNLDPQTGDDDDDIDR